MQETLSIQYLQHKEIDKEKWDLRIDTAPNGLIYGYSWYLDAMADNWDALIIDDYRFIMALPWRRKYGIYYIYQPFLCAQLGIFGNDISEEIFNQFIAAIPSKYKVIDYPFNHHNVFKGSPNVYTRTNYILNLKQPYEVITKGYRENIRRNIKKSISYGCRIKTGIDIDDVTSLSREFGVETDIKGLNSFKNIYRLLYNKDKAITYGVYNNKGDLMASCAFLFSHSRAYYLLVGNHPNGRTLGASHALIDGFIMDHAGKDILLDFEGSDLRNLSFFYSSYGGIEESYTAMKWNRLPWPISILKKQ